MIIEVEDRFCKVTKQFLKVLGRLQRAAASGEAVHEVEETAWFGLIEVGREMIVAYIKQQDEELPQPKSIEQEGKKLRRLPERRTRLYVSASPRATAKACRCDGSMRRGRSVATTCRVRNGNG